MEFSSRYDWGILVWLIMRRKVNSSMIIQAHFKLNKASEMDLLGSIMGKMESGVIRYFDFKLVHLLKFKISWNFESWNVLIKKTPLTRFWISSLKNRKVSTSIWTVGDKINRNHEFLVELKWVNYLKSDRPFILTELSNNRYSVYLPKNLM